MARSFAPRQLQGVLDSVETICTEVIDGFCEEGEADLVQVMSQPFPLLVICDMMGIPRSEFETVLDATNVILGARRPGVHGRPDPFDRAVRGGHAADQAHERAGRGAPGRTPPTTSPRSSCTTTSARSMLAPNEIAPFFILLAVAGNDTTRTAISHGMNLLSQNPDQRAIWQDDLDGVIADRGRGDRPRRVAGHVHAAHGHDRRDASRATTSTRATRSSCSTARPTATRASSTGPSASTCCRDPNPHVGFGGPGPHFCLGAHLARREVSVVFRQLLTRLPDIEVTGDPVPLDAMGIPLVGGIKRLPVRFTPTAQVGA